MLTTPRPSRQHSKGGQAGSISAYLQHGLWVRQLLSLVDFDVRLKWRKKTQANANINVSVIY